MTRVCPFLPIPAAVFLALTISLGARGSEAQGQSEGGTLGLRGVGYVLVHGGAARLPRNGRAAEAGIALDLGHFPVARFRLIGDAAFLRTVGYREYVEAEDREYRRPFYDLSGSVLVAVDARAPRSEGVPGFNPYLAAGVGVHALTSSFGTVSLDRRYNTNVFGVVAAMGTRIRFGGRRLLRVEARAVGAKSVRRVSLHLGTGILFNDLVTR